MVVGEGEGRRMDGGIGEGGEEKRGEGLDTIQRWVSVRCERDGVV